jgi:hypothetical protein
MNIPKLVDTNVKNYLFYSLKKCHDNRVYLYSIGLNVFVFCMFVGIFGLALYYCNKKKPSIYDKERQMLKDQEFILSKIRYYQQVSEYKKNTLSNITNLPSTDTLTNSLQELHS